MVIFFEVDVDFSVVDDDELFFVAFAGVDDFLWFVDAPDEFECYLIL